MRLCINYYLRTLQTICSDIIAKILGFWDFSSDESVFPEFQLQLLPKKFSRKYYYLYS